MEFEQGLLYHVDGLLRDEAWGDFIISRIPESVRYQLNEKAQKNILFVSNSELRFVMEEETVTTAPSTIKSAASGAVIVRTEHIIISLFRYKNN